MEKLTAAGFAATAVVIGALAVDGGDKEKLCVSILHEHAKALASVSSTNPGTPASNADKVKSEAPTPAAERDDSPIIAKMTGERARLHSPALSVASYKRAALNLHTLADGVLCRYQLLGAAWQV